MLIREGGDAEKREEESRNNSAIILQLKNKLICTFNAIKKIMQLWGRILVPPQGIYIRDIHNNIFKPFCRY